MDMISNHCGARELVIISLRSEIPSLGFHALPTVCLIVAEEIEDRIGLIDLIKKMNNLGCIFYLSYGAAADEIHDLVDDVIETGVDDWLNIVSTSHKNEEFRDVAWFFLNAAYLDKGDYRCMAFFLGADVQNMQASDLLLELHTTGKINIL